MKQRHGDAGKGWLAEAKPPVQLRDEAGQLVTPKSLEYVDEEMVKPPVQTR